MLPLILVKNLLCGSRVLLDDRIHGEGNGHIVSYHIFLGERPESGAVRCLLSILSQDILQEELRTFEEALQLLDVCPPKKRWTDPLQRLETSSSSR